ncbi:MAG: gliding motility lipoprotein GldB [Bacteroidia bacterium]
MKKFAIYISVFIALFISGCGSDRPDVDTSNISIPEVKINRLEQDVFKMDTANIKDATLKLEKKYGQFYSSYFTVLLNNGGIRDSSYTFRIKQFINDRDMKDAFNNCEKEFPTTDKLKEDFTESFKYFKYYFPNRKLPKVVTMITGFNYPAITIDSTIAIGLDMYLGSKNKFYQWLTFPRYKTMFMNKEDIMPDAVHSWMLTEFPYNMNKSDFLSEMVYMGKILYATDALLPETPDTLKIHYSNAQMGYCHQNEFNVWSYFASQKLIYTTDQSEIMKFTSDGPFTSAFSKEAPPLIGYWIGWQIVRQYMKNNPKVTLEQLMNEPDAQKILTKAKYKPAK